MKDSAEWGAAVLRVRRVAYAGAIVMIGLTGCTASAETPATTPTPGGGGPTVTTSPTVTISRKPIVVQLNPDRVIAGESSKVWILANCPIPTGGPAHTGTASSKAFLSGVTLATVPASSTISPSPSTSPTSPWVRGEATVSGTVARGTYVVDVKCDGTNDTGRATLRVVRATPDTTDETKAPTKAPRAGGGGTFGKDVDDESSMPIGPMGWLVGLGIVAAAGLLIKRRVRG
ncbi:hypothetical protein [Nonomuraea rhizosphaerae]|uniref:hypothetical protein n=1 Tax=Nonomuraea rhizosphaerae TaxID=2665663 RepID=UPI001C5F9652|nr:hypothetical protein [Nonomuraea rhizosphaerae]